MFFGIESARRLPLLHHAKSLAEYFRHPKQGPAIATLNFLGVFLLVYAAALCSGAPASAQDASSLPPIRIGIILPDVPDDSSLQAEVAKAAKQGAMLAQEEFALSASMVGITLAVVMENANGDEVVKAAQHLVDNEKVFALAGGFDYEGAHALSEWAASHGVPFLNLLESSDALRNQQCAATTFHLAPSAAMYLDAMAGWFVRAGMRRWYFVQADTEDGEAQYTRASWAIDNRHFGAREIGKAVVTPGQPLPDSTVADIQQSGADLVVMLLSASDQLKALSQLESAGIGATVTGFPYSETQTRAFFKASREAAPKLGAGYRATAWEPTMDAYGARELNARYLQRWKEPMEESAWATYQAVKIFFEAALFTRSVAPKDILGYINAQDTVFDIWKGIGTSFRPWDRQLRQSLYLVKIDEKAADPIEIGHLVGELPAIYMPGTDPHERLDQLGDLEAQSLCKQQ